ncbi:MAG TPA: cytochrome c [Sphingomicrobium sp.]|nr:cytochrome c [Sphingomicrobium sp.]
MTRALAVALLLLAGCDRKADQNGAVSATPAALTYEGANYRNAAEKVAHGKRLATILDCTGCHGTNLQGSDLAEKPEDGAMYAPNLTLLLAKYSDAQLDRLIRGGVPRDGREFWFMPVESYQFLSDADLAAIIAYLRTVEPAGKPLPAFQKNRALEKEIAAGTIGNAQAQIAKFRKETPVDLGPEHAWGRYLAQNSCSACHNNSLQGWEGFTPSLDVAGAYSKEELTHLLTIGEGKVKKDLGMMTGIARNSFSKLTPREREAIVDYVKARAERLAR